MKIKKVLVSGASGFVGQNLIKSLLEHKSIEQIYCIYNKNKPKIINKLKIKIFKINLTSNKNLNKIPNDFDILIHLAGKRDSFLEKKEAEDQIRDNTLITQNLLQKMIVAKCKKIIFFSSVYIYSGNKKKTYDEVIDFFPIEALGRSKFFSESLINNFAKKFKIKCITFRAFTIYGNGSKEGQFFTKVIKDLNSKKSILKFGNEFVKRDFIYIEDVCCAVIIAINNFNKLKKNFLGLNLAYGKSISIKKSLQIASDVLNKNKKIKFNSKSKLRTGDKDHYANIENLKKFLQWHPGFDLKKGLNQMIKKLTDENKLQKYSEK